MQSVAVRMVVEREREIRAFTAREYWTLEALLETAGGATFTADLVRIDGKTVDIGDGETAERHAAAIRRPASRSSTRSRRASPSATRPRRSPPARSSRRRAASSASAPSGRCRSPSGCTRASTRPTATSASSPTCGRTRRRSPAWPWPRRRRSSRRASASAYGTGKGRVYKTKREGRPGGARVDPADLVHARPGLAARARSRPRSCRLYRLIWQRAIASQMAPKELETTTAELVGGRLPAAGLGDPDAVRRLLAGLHRGPGRHRRRGGRAHAPAARRGRRRRASVDVTPTQHFTEPPPRFTEATLIKALEEHGIGRPSTYAATISTIVDRGYVRVEERRLHPEEIGEIVTDLLVDALRRVRGPRVHRAHGGGARRGRPRRARVGAAAARVLRRRSRTRVDEKRTRAQARATSRPRRPTRCAPRATRW